MPAILLKSYQQVLAYVAVLLHGESVAYSIKW